MGIKRSKGVIFCGVIFLILAASIPLNRLAYKKAFTREDAKAAIADVCRETGRTIDEATAGRLIEKMAASFPYDIRRVFFLLLFILYAYAGSTIIFNKKISFVVIPVTFYTRIFYSLFNLYTFYDAYRIPSIIISGAYFPVPKLDSYMVYMVFYYAGFGLLFSIAGLLFFTRPKIKEQFK